MPEKIPKVMLEKHPQLKQIFRAIEQFREVGKSTVICTKCKGVVIVDENQDVGSLSTNCDCGYCKYRISWNANENQETE